MTERPEVQNAFQQLSARARSAWEASQQTQTPRILIGAATCGRAAGALDVIETFSRELRERQAQAEIVQIGCMGFCYAEPLVIITKPPYPPIVYGYVTPGIASRLVTDFLLGEDLCIEFALGALEPNDMIPPITDQPRFQIEKRLLLRNCGLIDPENIEHYIAKGGYAALAKALQMDPAGIIGEMKKSGLKGRGGAGYPTWLKWQQAASFPAQPKYVICNADEGDPGAFMDRSILESDPHSVIEGMIIGGIAVGTKHGYMYVRAEYPLAVARVQTALKQAREKGLLGENILGSGYSYDIQVMQGAGAFVSGESTALMYALEGKRGMPRVRPPHSVECGFMNKPTVLNNVKTFASVPLIIDKGGEAFAAIGNGNTGTTVFALAGKAVNTGLVEVPLGATLRQLVFDVGGGVAPGKKFKAVQIGGPSGGCLPESELDVAVDFDSLKAAGGMMGSGGMVVLDEDNCMVDTARFFLDFTTKESCGKCSLCRLGSRQLLDILEDMVKGKGSQKDLQLLVELSEDMKLGCLCGLGKTAPNPVLTTLRYFRDEYEAHINEHRCPSLMCEDLIAYYIKPDLCERSCEACVGSCPVECIRSARSRVKVIEQAKCVKCGSCLTACPPQYNAVVKLSPPGLVPPEEP